jgi:DNA-binding GntR family transcriptional regulator
MVSRKSAASTAGPWATATAGRVPAPGKTLSMQIADGLIAAIGRGDIPPGTRLNEAEIAESSGTSRGPVREALRYVQEAGLIEAVPHQGSFVISPSADELAEMVVMRSLLEGFAARTMVAADGEGLAALDRIVAEMRSTVETDDLERFRELDWQFHETLCGSSQLATLTRTWHQLRSRIGLMMVSNTQARDLKERVDDHEQLASMLRGASPEEAERIVRSRGLERGFAWLQRPVPDVLRDVASTA